MTLHLRQTEFGSEAFSRGFTKEASCCSFRLSLKSEGLLGFSKGGFSNPFARREAAILAR